MNEYLFNSCCIVSLGQNWHGDFNFEPWRREGRFGEGSFWPEEIVRNDREKSFRAKSCRRKESFGRNQFPKENKSTAQVAAGRNHFTKEIKLQQLIGRIVLRKLIRNIST